MSFITYCEENNLIYSIKVSAESRDVTFDYEDDRYINNYIISLEIEDSIVSEMHITVLHPQECEIDLFDVMDEISGDYETLYAAFYSEHHNKLLKRKGITIEDYQSFIILDKIWVEPKWRNKGICTYLTGNIFTLLERSCFENTDAIAHAIWVTGGFENDTQFNREYAQKLVYVYKKIPNTIYFSSKSLKEDFFYMPNVNYKGV